MITLFTGMPGAGKTAALVDFLSKLPGDRPLFVDGLNGLTLPHTVVDSNDWPAQLPDGSILVIDEVQRVWRPRGAGAKVPEAVAALETHRHRGIDVFVTTQAPRLLDSNVRGLVGRHIHIRDTGILGRYWYEWPESNDSMQWKTCVNKRRFKLPKKAFSLYKSSSLHTTPVRGVPTSLYVGIVALLVLSLLVYGVYKIIQRTQAPVLPALTVSQAKEASKAHASAAEPVQASGGYDYASFIPRVSNKPESAPAYDHLRIVAAMPLVTAGFCAGQNCRCFTNQGTDPGLSPRECRQFVENPPFDPYRQKEVTAGAASAGTPHQANASPAPPSKSEI